MKKVFYIILSLLLFRTEFLVAQNYIYGFNQISVQPDTSVKIFLLSQNPSLLNYDEDEELLYIKSSQIFSNEKFNRYFDPEKINFYQFQFSGKKKIGENQIFKGVFGFNKLIRKNWNWVFSKDYNEGNPFLLGDSSSGSSTFNGIFFNANYFNQIFSNSSIGAGIEYFVDEGLKQVSPRPTSQHRNIKFILGFSHSPIDLIQFALAGIVEDKKEEISYKEDEGAVYKEVTLFKFRGLDFPVVVKKKTETRILFHNIYEINGDLIIKPSESLLILNRIEKGIEQTISKEEITNPVNQGYFQNDYLKFKMKSELKLNKKAKYNLNIDLFKSNSWSKHPDFNSLISDQNQKFFSLSGNFSYRINESISIHSGLGFGQFNFNLNDYYSNVLFDLKSQLISFQTGLKFNFKKSLSLETNFLIENYKPFYSSEYFNNSGIYFISFLRRDLDYFKTEFNRYCFSLLLTMKLFSGEILLIADYNHLKTKNNLIWNNSSNQEIRTSIEYRIKVY
ncbi:MAG: hypothetical protein HPY57_07620 [Ignavibacteria bacterium]|nr:hypothetical protein [Ignavibacteria bacterium]